MFPSRGAVIETLLNTKRSRKPQHNKPDLKGVNPDKKGLNTEQETVL